MRRRSLAFLVAVAVAATTLAAQGRGGGGQVTAQNAGSTLMITGDHGPIDGAEIRLFQNGRMQTLGATIAGKFTENPSLLSGKPQIDVRVDKCPNQPAPIFNLYVSGAASAAAENDFKGTENCDHDKILAAFFWGSNWAYRVRLKNEVGKPFYKNPIYDAAIGGGVAAGLFFATRDSNSDNNNGNNNGTPPTFDSFVGNYNLSATTNGVCGFHNFTGTFYIGGTMPATMLQIIENATFNYNGNSSLDGTTLKFNGTGSGSVTGIGTYTGTITGQITSDKKVTGTETLTFPCGTVSNAFTAQK